MKIIILGSGTGVPSLKCNAPGYYLAALGKEILIDCGSGSLLRLERSGLSYTTLDAVFFTHAHPDHVGDLLPLIHALKVTPGFRREKRLSLFGPRGFVEFFRRNIITVASLPKHFSVEAMEIGDFFEFDGLRCFTTPTVHSDTLHSVAYRFEVDTRAVVFSGDCDYDQGIVQHAKQADLFIVDCSFPQALKMAGHCSASECGQLAKQANVKQLVLSHLYPIVGREDTRLAECREIFSGSVKLAEDLMEFQI